MTLDFINKKSHVFNHNNQTHKYCVVLNVMECLLTDETCDQHSILMSVVLPLYKANFVTQIYTTAYKNVNEHVTCTSLSKDIDIAN